MKLAIVGSRTVTPMLRAKVLAYVASLAPSVTVVSGGARGVDTIAVDAARKRGLPTMVIPADWSLGKGAGFQRNGTIVESSDAVVAFWDGVSRGTEDTIRKAHKAGKLLQVFTPSR